MNRQISAWTRKHVPLFVTALMLLSALAPVAAQTTKTTLTVTADDQQRNYGESNPALTLTYFGFINGDTPASLTTQPAATVAATTASPPGVYPITASGGRSDKYDFNYFAGTLTVNQSGQTTFSVTQGANITKTYGDTPFTLGTSGGMGIGAVTWSSDTPGVATVNAATGQVAVVGAGTTIISATKAGDGNYQAATAQTTVTVNIATLTVTADDKSMLAGQNLPTLTITYSGWVNGESATTAAGFTAPTISTTATSSSPAGTYPITLSGGSADNYTFTLHDGTMTVNAVSQATLYILDSSNGIISGMTDNYYYGDAPFTLETTGGSGNGAVTWSSSNTSVVTVDGNGNVTVVSAGTAVINATKAADGIYAATTATLTIQVNPSYVLTYDANGGSSAPAAVYNHSVPFNATVTAGIGMTPPSNKTFVCWNTAADGSGTSYNPGESITLTGNITIYAVWWLGSGTSTDPYQVYNYATLNAVRNNLTAHYKVVSDIDAGSAWVPIGNGSSGTAATMFTGAFDGGGHTVTIDGITPTVTPYYNSEADDTEEYEEYIGLFGNLGTGGVIQDVLVDGSLSYGSNNDCFIGGVLGLNDGGTVQNCAVTADVTCTSTAVKTYVGGVVGSNYPGTIQNCYTTGNVSAVNTITNTVVEVGGIAGQNGYGGSVTACYATGSVQAITQGTGAFSYGGGIVGSNYGTTNNCVALNVGISAPAATPHIGRVAGSNGGGTLSNNYAINISGLPNGTVGDTNGATITTPVTQANFTTAGFSFGSTDASPWVWGATYPILWWQ